MRRTQSWSIDHFPVTIMSLEILILAIRRFAADLIQINIQTETNVLPI
jgi:hypothetical protein